ncbi:alpha-amylase family glycosyl hydrolase [Cereibacter sphaeroides f. sp. denitrificans]
MSVRATYRIQFTSDFRFSDAARLAPYFARLGISHLYASPILAAREGSTHGYDGVHYSLISPELGGEEEFRAMAATFREHGMGVIVDFVPNHMGVGGADNVFWLSVLEWGRQSPVADWFDIDWESATPGLAGKVLMPFLGDQYGDVLAQGDMELRYEPDRGAFAIWAGSRSWPRPSRRRAPQSRPIPSGPTCGGGCATPIPRRPSRPSGARPAISTAGPRSTGWPRRRTGARSSSRWTATRSTTAASSP